MPPIGELEWPDAERLFLRLLHTVRPVQYAKLFGVPGQAQAGIDAYARLPLDLTLGESGSRDYITLQSRRIQTLTATKIKKAVDDLLKGEWADKTAAFHFATSFDLQDTKLDAAIRQQTERLANLKITFVPWGVQEVSSLLKYQPCIVDDFFGRPWVERFCGPDAAQTLANNLPHQDSRDLRAGLRDLYHAVFSAQGGVHLAENADSDGEFVILDVHPNRQQADIIDAERPEPTVEDQHPAGRSGDGRTYIASRLGARRQSFRSARQLIKRRSQAAPATVGAVAADEWLAGGKYRLLIGRPGAGKSSLLRFVATDLLSSQPQSIALQREHATDLPIWLPFGFLCRHLEASTESSLVSAAEAWLKSQSATHLWPLVQRALRDDRLLLLVDGVDEWSDVGAAERALGILEAFLGGTTASAILSTRPYAVDRLNWRRPWAQAEITPLTDRQRSTIAAGILQPVAQSEAAPTVPSMWMVGVEPFLDQLDAIPELAELSRSPLFLTLLAATWQGEPLPRQRFKIYARLVELLLEKHPQMRQRASHAGGTLLPATEVTTLSLPWQLRNCHTALPDTAVIVAHFYDIESGRKDLADRGRGDAHELFQISIPRDGGIHDLLDEAQRPDRRFDVVICEDISRIGRRSYTSTEIEHRLEEAGVMLVAADEPFRLDTSGRRAKTSTQVLTRRVKQGVAEWYVMEMLEKSWDGFETRTEQGYNIGKPPYGYRADKIPHPVPAKRANGLKMTLLQVEPTEGAVVRKAFGWRVVERVGYQTIADRLNEDHATNPPPTPVEPDRAVGLWTYSNVRDMLTNPKQPATWFGTAEPAKAAARTG